MAESFLGIQRFNMCSQEPSTGPHPEPDETSSHFPFLFSKIHSNIILPSTSRSLEWSLPFMFSNHDTVCISYQFDTGYTLPIRLLLFQCACSTYSKHSMFQKTRTFSVAQVVPKNPSNSGTLCNAHHR